MVVTVGFTDLFVPVTVPTPWLMLRLVAPVTLQASVELRPLVMVDGVAVKVEMTGTPPPPPVVTEVPPPPEQPAETTTNSNNNVTVQNSFAAYITHLLFSFYNISSLIMQYIFHFTHSTFLHFNKQKNRQKVSLAARLALSTMTQ
jgi:hypothetical protein